MTVAKDTRYAYGSVLGRMQSGVRPLIAAFVMGVVAAFLGLGLVEPLKTVSEMVRGFLFVALGAVAMGLLLSFISRQNKEIRGLAGEVDFQWKQAVGRDDGNELFDVFPPTQQAVDLTLSVRGTRMGNACRALAAFTQRHPELLAARAKGSPSHVPDDILKEEGKLQEVLDGAKASFWNLHSMLWRKARQRYDLRDTWQAYDNGAIPSADAGDEEAV